MSGFNSPFLLGFDHLEQMIENVARGGDGYPPYNIEQITVNRLRISLAVAGFQEENLSILLENNQLVIKGQQSDAGADRDYIHRGIAARQFIRKFVLADGMEVQEAFLEHGLLHIDLTRVEPKSHSVQIPIRS